MQHAPRQEAGRFSERELILSRANKSVRLFAHVVDRLAQGLQPDIEQVRSIGYLMRTTAVYGNGKFGIADREVIADRPGLGGPFAAEMLLVWLIRGFTHDLVEHVAERRRDHVALLFVQSFQNVCDIQGQRHCAELQHSLPYDNFLRLPFIHGVIMKAGVSIFMHAFNPMDKQCAC